MKKIFVIIAVLLVVILGGAGAFTLINKSNKTNSSTIDSDGNKETVAYTLEMSNYKFSPNIIKAEPGKKIKIRLKTVSGSHNFAVPDLNIESNTLSSGNELIIDLDIPADAAGKSYQFYCTFHKNMGMTGVIEVGSI